MTVNVVVPVIVPLLVLPSPQPMLAEKVAPASAPPGSVNMATVWDAEVLPSLALKLKLPLALTAGSLTVAVEVTVAVGALSWLMMTVIV